MLISLIAVGNRLSVVHGHGRRPLALELNLTSEYGGWSCKVVSDHVTVEVDRSDSLSGSVLRLPLTLLTLPCVRVWPLEIDDGSE